MKEHYVQYVPFETLVNIQGEAIIINEDNHCRNNEALLMSLLDKN